MKKSKSKVKLNVGGVLFTTSKTSLTSIKDSFFYLMLSNETWKPDEDGEYFIDREPKYFQLILQKLRYGECDYTNLSDFEKSIFKVDIDFYGLSSLFPELMNEDNLFSNGFDVDGGILRWIGTKEGTREWGNPFLEGLVHIRSSCSNSYRSLNYDEGYCEFVRQKFVWKFFWNG